MKSGLYFIKVRGTMLPKDKTRENPSGPAVLMTEDGTVFVEIAPRPTRQPLPNRLTHYDEDLGRFVVPVGAGENPELTSPFCLKTGKTEREPVRGIIFRKDPDLIFGDIVDRLAYYENKEEEEAKR